MGNARPADNVRLQAALDRFPAFRTPEPLGCGRIYGVLAVLNWVAIGLLVGALVPAGLAWAGRVKFHRWLPAEQSRPAGRAFALLGLGALLQAVAQLADGAARWAISSPGLVLVVLGAVLVLRLRTGEPAQSSG